LDVTGVAEITGATKLKSTLDVTGATNMASTLNVKGDTTILGKFNQIIDSDRDIISKSPSYWRTLGVGIYRHFVKTPIPNWWKNGLLETIIPHSKPDEGIIRQEYKEHYAHLIRWEDTNKDTWSDWHRYTISPTVNDITLVGNVLIKGSIFEYEAYNALFKHK